MRSVVRDIDGVVLDRLINYNAELYSSYNYSRAFDGTYKPVLLQTEGAWFTLIGYLDRTQW